jgi:hypothetical protein
MVLYSFIFMDTLVVPVTLHHVALHLLPREVLIVGVVQLHLTTFIVEISAGASAVGLER